MDDSRKPGNSVPTKYPWQTDEASGGNLGATGVFGTAPDSSIDTGPVSTHSGDEENSAVRGEVRGSARQTPDPGGQEGPREPIVHKVVLGSGSATVPIDLLELLRSGSPKAEPTSGPALAEAETSPWTPAFQPAPAKPSGPPPAQSSEGFTQLLRALSGDSAVASTAKQPEAIQQTVARSDSPLARSESGFTALIAAQDTSDRNQQPQRQPDFRTPTPAAPPSDGAGGFTALLQGFSGSSPDSGGGQPKVRALDETPRPLRPVDTPVPPVYPSGQAGPGAFTQLFSALTSETAVPAETNPGRADPPPIYTERNPASGPSGGGTSFTQLISNVGETPSKASTHGDDRPSLLEDFSRKPSQGREDPLGPSQFPTGIADWSRTPVPQPGSLSGSGGVTRLLRILDEPAKGPEMPVAYPPADAPIAPSPSGPSLFTQTYKRLDEPVEPLAPTPPPSYSPPSKLSATQPFASPFTGGIFPDPGPAGPVAPNPQAGPSEFTRMIDASKLREMQRQGGSAPAASGPSASAQPLPSQPGMPMPPAAPSLQWQPQMPPVPAAGQPPQFNPAMQMPNPAMQMPQYMPPAAMPQMPALAPVAAPAPAAPPAMGKMQQYLPLLLIIIIFLLVVILVTVVFLLKH